ncbi:hypothetical protein MLP_43880 [Microlunatus phosphovorus NM-1]|uniref:Uncharacterized protein n=1 Tax=Microlunatus phosphovorus (strain ATCC 700054 / DSM 10555 / JCM 9379 / NBRC 101784 / NCIMB 13414 / VKM Ac-1990 / NM-1) TaxID=1032480 RepID=F5XSZ4_MICPN|nr:hypothetical protein MLP_43880 [Microlunatus phosphovorus NM-1]
MCVVGQHVVLRKERRYSVMTTEATSEIDTRRLVTVETIAQIDEIPDADAIEAARVRG